MSGPGPRTTPLTIDVADRDVARLERLSKRLGLGTIDALAVVALRSGMDVLEEHDREETRRPRVPGEARL